MELLDASDVTGGEEFFKLNSGGSSDFGDNGMGRVIGDIDFGAEVGSVKNSNSASVIIVGDAAEIAGGRCGRGASI